ncbi:hypothetical protein QBC35DRAFT_502786 [Podospora australis]|uniref:4-coumarate--CoA ligase n=1 Tax=Podospora australis TaxID=1536484 RepID=A0AAN6WPB9_9PEZI|nr:hypothetical protein QBC35DRAFT_502786 [Podospora australis]
MIFHPPAWLPAITENHLSELGTISDFVLKGQPKEECFNPSPAESPVLVTSQGDKSKTASQLADDVEALAATLSRDLGWPPNDAADKVIAILSENTLDYMTCCWAIHRLGATCLLLHGSTPPNENAAHLKKTNCTVLITSPTLLPSARAALSGAGVSESESRLYLNGPNSDDQLKTIETLLTSGTSLSPLPSAPKNPIAYLCPTSGTSGTQKLVRMTHSAIIANILQLSVLERLSRSEFEIVLGVLPLSHVQGIVASHCSVYLRDRIIVHSKFDMQAALASIQTFKINRLYLVPSVLAALMGNPFLFKAFNLSSIKSVYVGAGNVTPELRQKVKAAQAGWNIVTGYGLTESPCAVAMSSPREYVDNTVGVLLSSYQAKLLREDGTEVEGFDEPGELVVSSPNQAAGYFPPSEADTTFSQDGWLRTGDVALFRKSPDGDAHLSIVDRLRDMIKVKGLQVSPVTMEACLREHEKVADAAVIGVADELAGERPKAFVVLARKLEGKEAEEEFFDELDDFVEERLAESHWLRGRYEIIEALPRNPSGKVSKGVLRAKERGE